MQYINYTLCTITQLEFNFFFAAINECYSSPCGKYECINGAGDFTCICKDGMTGKQCEIPPDFCKENNCKNGATCNSLADSYNCSCVAGYTGPFCEVAPGPYLF